MPRPRTILQNEFPYHIRARSVNREQFQIPLDEVWNIMCRQLTYLCWAYDLKIHAFVLMKNHFHLLATTPHANLSEIMANFMKETSRVINETSGRINQAYGARHSRSVIPSQRYYLHAYKYVYRNPVAAGAVDLCENYPYSTLNGLLGFSRLEVPVCEDTLLFDDVLGTLDWLNTDPEKELWQMVGVAMRKKTFQLPKSDSHRRHRLEFDAL